MDQKMLYQIYKACRLCGIGDGYKMPIIQNFIDLDETDIHLKKKIADSLQIQVFEGDKMPPLICELCVDKVDDYFAFKERCKQISELTRKKLGLPAQDMKTEKKERDDSPKRDVQKEKALAKRESDIKIKETKLKERDIELKSRDKALRVKEIDLKQRDAELKQKEAAVKVKETQVKNKDSQLKSFDAILRNKDVELTLRQNQIKGKEQELQQLEESKNQKLKEKELALKKKETELKRKEGILKKLEAESLRKIEAERAELKKESLKRTRELEIEEPVQKSRTSRSSSVSSKPSKVPRRSELERLDGGRNSRTLAANAASSQEPQQELATKLTRSRERDIPETPPPPDKKPKVAPAKPTSAAKSPEQDHQCVVCSGVFKTLKNFKNHLRSHYVNTNPKYVCNPCHLWFTNSEEMLSHQREHKVNGLRYKCTNCEFSFTTEKDYQEHFTKLDCYIYTVPDVQCGSCWRLFATETLKSQHSCPGEDARGPGTCTSCSKTFEFLKDLKEHEVSCTGKPKETNSTVNESAAPLADVEEQEVENSSKTRGPENVLADTEVLTSLRPVQVRTEKCDALLTNSIEDSVNVSNVDYNYGLDKTCVYPYFTLYPRIKQEPGFNYFQGMVRIDEDVRNEFLLEDYIHWDSEESESECSDVKKRGEKVKTLAQLSLKVIFSKKLIGKVPRKRRKIKNEIQSVLNVSLFDLGANCFDFSENMDEGNEAVNNIIANLGRDDNLSKDAKNQKVTDKNDSEKIGSDKNENCAGGSNKTINIPEHSNDVSLYEEYIESKNNEEQQSRSNCEVDSKTTDQAVGANEGKCNDNDEENSSGDRTKSVNNINAYDVQNKSDSSNNSIKDVNTEMTSQTGIESKIENENIASRNSEEQQSSLNSEPINNEFDSNKNDSNEDNASEKPKSEDDNSLNVFQNNSNAPLINNSVQSDVTDVTEELKSKTNDSMVMECTEKALDSLEPHKSDQISHIVVSDSHENGDLNDTKPFTENAKTNIEKSDDNKYSFITHTNNCIPFFESDNEKKIHSNEENIEIQTQSNEKLHCKSDIAENSGKNEEGAEMEKLFRDLNELSQDSNSSVTTDQQNKTKDVEMDDGRLMAELNRQIGEDTDKTQVKDSVHSKTVESNVNQDSIDSVDKRSLSLDDVSDADSVNKRSPSLDDVSDADSNFD